MVSAEHLYICFLKPYLEKMKRIKILLFGLVVLTIFSCEKNEDAIYVSHRFGLTAERNLEYDVYIDFTWNEAQMGDNVEYLLVETFEEKDNSFFTDVADYIINYENYTEYPSWMYDCNVYSTYSDETYRQLYDYNYDNKSYYTMIALNSEGRFLISNTVYI
jgi:hypothetical protein